MSEKEDIRERVKSPKTRWSQARWKQTLKDREWLLAEVDRLNLEVEQLRAEAYNNLVEALFEGKT